MQHVRDYWRAAESNSGKLPEPEQIVGERPYIKMASGQAGGIRVSE